MRILRLHVNGEDLMENSTLLRSIKDIPMVIDHFGHVGFEGGLDFGRQLPNLS